MTDPLITQLASTGVVGLVAAIFLYLYLQERKGRIEDAKAFMSIAMALQKEVITAVTKLSEIVETWEKKEEERERLRAATQQLPYREPPPPERRR